MANVWARSSSARWSDPAADTRFRSRHGVVVCLARLTDATVLTATTLLTVALLDGHDPDRERCLLVASVGGAAAFMLHDAPGRYLLERRRAETRLLFRTCLPSFALAALAFVLFALMVGRAVAPALRDDAVWSGLSLPALFVGRRFADRMLAHEGLTARLTERLLVVGEGEAARRMARLLALDPLIRVTSLAASGEAMAPCGEAEALCADVELIVGRCDLAAGAGEIDGVVLALPRERRVEACLIRLAMRRVHVDLYAEPALSNDDPLEPLVQVGGCTLAVLQRRPLTAGQRLSKDVFDRVVGLLLLLPLLPLILGLMAVVRLGSPGPALFRQPRVGLHGRRFEILKLRTMRVDEADLLADRQTALRDTRVTREGRWLRRLSLDELPQLFNVARGEMSLVGPRPHAPNTRAAGKLLNEALAEYVIRQQVKPGITGWAQINGSRGQIQTVEQLRRRVELDLEYMRRWSLAFDVRILVLTAFREVFSKHAY